MIDNIPMIDRLVADLAPVRRVRPRDGVLAVACGLGIAVTLVALVFGLRADLMAGHPAGIVLLRSGTLLLLGAAALSAVVAAARPGVGQSRHGWRWALGAAALFPLVTLVHIAARRELPMDDLASPLAPWCLGISLAGALLVGGAVTAWLRKGAPVALGRAGWLVGLAAGAFGTFAYSLHCPSESVGYIGIWYSSVVGLAALAGRLVVPRLLRW